MVKSGRALGWRRPGDRDRHWRRLFDKTGSQIPLNAPRAWTQLYTGPTTLHFVAKYRATGNQVTGGAANAQAWFSLTYPVISAGNRNSP
jgi:hypothetical protein